MVTKTKTKTIIELKYLDALYEYMSFFFFNNSVSWSSTPFSQNP